MSSDLGFDIMLGRRIAFDLRCQLHLGAHLIKTHLQIDKCTLQVVHRR